MVEHSPCWWAAGGGRGRGGKLAQPTTTPAGLVADLLKWLGAISRFLNNYTILIVMDSPLATGRFAFETCTQAPSDMCITTILFKWQQAVVELIQCVISFLKLIKIKLQLSTDSRLRVFVAEGSQDYARRQA